MESEPRKLKKRRVRVPKTFKQKLKAFIKNLFGVKTWQIAVLIPFLIGIIILTILLWVANLVDYTNINTTLNTNQIPIVEPKNNSIMP